MRPADVLSRPARPPDLTLTYGRPDQVADLFLPPADRGPAAAPLVVFLHGGFWRAAYDRKHAGPLAEALAAAGFAVCVPEYRRVGQDGGGWPGTFDDVRAAVARLPDLVAGAAAGRADAAALVLAGHSAGGHLALWATGQPAGAAVRAVVSLAGVCDLAACYREGLGQRAAGGLMGGSPEQLPDRYEMADPMAAIPLTARVILIHGRADEWVPWQQSDEYATAATAAGAAARCVLLPETGHFELIDPLSDAWPAVLAEFRTAAGFGRTT
jgi:acetyl esterase/lipase